jgi:hypothetical protein
VRAGARTRGPDAAPFAAWACAGGLVLGACGGGAEVPGGTARAGVRSATSEAPGGAGSPAPGGAGSPAPGGAAPSAEPTPTGDEFAHWAAVCGALDFDQDGVPNARDRCPRAAERWNGFRDDDGCADFADDDFRDRWHFDDAAFPIGSTTPAEPGLVATWTRDVARLPFVTRFAVVGTAAPDEPDPAALARARAEALRAALVTAGVAADRVVARAEPPRERREEYAGGSLVRMEPASRPGAFLVVEAIEGTSLTGEQAWDGPEPLARDAVPERCRWALPGRAPMIDHVPLLYTSPDGACGWYVAAQSDPGDDLPSCRTKYALAEVPGEGPIREVAVLAIDTSGDHEQIMVTVREPLGWHGVAHAFDLDASPLSSVAARVDRLEVADLFGGGAPEVLLELRTREQAGETVGADDWELTAHRTYVVVCSIDSGRLACRTLLRAYDESERRRRLSRDGNRTLWDRTKRDRGAVLLAWAADGTLTVNPDAGGAGQLRRTLGRHRWPELPPLPRIRPSPHP